MSGQSDLDRQIEQLKNCELIKEAEVKQLCQKAKEILVEEANVQRVFAPVTVCSSSPSSSLSSSQKNDGKSFQKLFSTAKKFSIFFFTCTQTTKLTAKIFSHRTTNQPTKIFHLNRFVEISMVNSTIWRNCSKWAVMSPIRTTCLWVISSIEASTVSKPFSCS